MEDQINSFNYAELVPFVGNGTIAADNSSNFLTDEDQLLRNILCSWNFESLFDLLKSEEINRERLLYMNDEDLKQLLKDYKLGVRIEFRRRLTEWKIQNNVTTWSTCTTITNTDGQSGSQEVEISASTPSTVSRPSSSSPTPSYSTFNLFEAIKNNANGDYVFRVFNKNKKLDDASRKIIIDAIIVWHMQRSLRITRPMFQALASEIEKEFKDSKNIYYKKTGSVPSGRLYDKYQNHTKRLRKLGILNSTLEESPIGSPGSNADVEESDVDETLESETTKERENYKLWLQVNDKPWAEVESKWINTFKLRRKEILNKLSYTANILKHWPLYKHSQGLTLIGLDFSNLYKETCFNLLNKWATFKTIILPVLNEKVKDKHNINLLKLVNSVDVEDVSCDVVFALVVHALLPPTIKHVKKDNNIKKLIVKSTIKDSQDSFFLQVNVVNDLERQIDVYRNLLISRNETLQPIIIGIAALDCCYKVFHVLDLQYPKDSCNFWIFVQKYFFDLDISKDKVTPSVLCLINDLS